MGWGEANYEFGATPHEVVLGSEERVLWTGRPTGQLFVFTTADLFAIPFSLVWGGFALLWNIMVWVAGAPLLFKLWGLPFLVVGFYISVGRFLLGAYERRNTIYVLTDQRAIIVRRGREESVSERYLAAVGDVETDLRSNGTGTIVFEPPTRHQRENRTAYSGFAGFQFFRISDAAVVIDRLQTETVLAYRAPEGQPMPIEDTPGWRAVQPPPPPAQLPPPEDGRPSPSPWK